MSFESGIFRGTSGGVLADCESGKVKGIVSAISLNNVHYILSRHIGKNKALEAVRIVLNVFTVAALDEKILRLAADLSHKGFEDAIQFHSAVAAGATCIITRDAAISRRNEFRFCHPPLSGNEFVSSDFRETI